MATDTATSKKLRPLGDRVVIQPVQREEMTKSGIVLPDTAKEKPQEGVIIAAGPGRILDDGKREAMDVKVGDRVLYSKYAGTEFKVDGEELLIVKQSDILAVVEAEALTSDHDAAGLCPCAASRAEDITWLSSSSSTRPLVDLSSAASTASPRP